MPDDASIQDGEDRPTPGAVLALSGGGYRAMVFHVGALWRLNEVGLLGRLSRISSVSGGSITAAALGLAWKDLQFTNGTARQFDAFVADIRRMARTSVDVGAVIGGIFLPGTISDRVSEAYDRVLFKGATLQDLPAEQEGSAPRFVINATNVQTSALWRFSRDLMGDYRVGLVKAPAVALAKAVAASSAFPPILSPMTLPLDRAPAPVEGADLNRPPFTERAVLADGGVYDNLGLEPLKGCGTVLVSDAGQKIAPEDDPAHDWARHAVRVLDLVDNQVRSLRKRHLMAAYTRGDLTGCYWGVRTEAQKYAIPTDPLGVAGRDPSALAALPTRLESLPDDVQERLINWGYAVCDAALRAHITVATRAQLGISIDEPKGFPYPQGY